MAYNSSVVVTVSGLGSKPAAKVRLKPEAYTWTITTMNGCHNCWHGMFINSLKASSIPYYSRVSSYSTEGGYYDDYLIMKVNGKEYDRNSHKSGALMSGTISLNASDEISFYQDDSGGTACCTGWAEITFDYAYSD